MLPKKLFNWTWSGDNSRPDQLSSADQLIWYVDTQPWYSKLLEALDHCNIYLNTVEQYPESQTRQQDEILLGGLFTILVGEYFALTNFTYKLEFKILSPKLIFELEKLGRAAELEGPHGRKLIWVCCMKALLTDRGWRLIPKYIG